MVLYDVRVVGHQRTYLRLGSFLFLVVLLGVCVVGRRCGTSRLESFLLLVVLYGVWVVGRHLMYLEAGVFSFSGGLVWRARSRASA